MWIGVLLSVMIAELPIWVCTIVKVLLSDGRQMGFVEDLGGVSANIALGLWALVRQPIGLRLKVRHLRSVSPQGF